MKPLFILILVCPTIVFSQIKGAYFNYRGGIAVKDGVTKGIGHFSAGLTRKESIGAGLGIGFIQFEQAYFPLTFDVCFLGSKEKAGPIVIGSAGYGLYKKTNPLSIIRGGFTGSLNIGAGLPVNKLAKIFLTAGYSIYGFKEDRKLQITGESIQEINSVKMFTITLGLRV